MTIKHKKGFYVTTLALLIGCNNASNGVNLAFASANSACTYETTGTTVPNTSGTPVVINTATGTVISANFFDSGAIDPPYFDGMEFVSVCINDPDPSGGTTATITTDVGLDNDTRIKAYPQFVIGTKFGNIYETSFRYYPNTGLPADQQWPVKAENLNDLDNPYQFANLEYVSQTKGIGLPAFTNDLPEINVTLDIDESNVIGAERDVMLESWFYDTSANADIIGNNLATGQSHVNTLNNIVGIGHPHYVELDNTLLEMMVHIGPLSPNDISGATRNPGQNQLTENYSGKDFDGDGIDDHFDVDSHVNVNNNLDPQPGIYSSGIDNNFDGIDDADLLPIVIGDYAYSIWYGESFLSPIIIFSRETNSSLTNNFDPLTADMALTEEGEMILPWSEFIEYTLSELESPLASLNVSWVVGANNPFPKMSGPSGAISGIEFGVEQQINAPSDLPYSATINKFDVNVDGNIISLNDTTAPITTINNTSVGPNGNTTISGTASDNIAIDRNRLLVRNIVTGEYWTGAVWTKSWTWFAPNGTDNWTYDVSLSDGAFATTAWTWDTSNNIGNIVTEYFSVGRADTSPPMVLIDPLEPLIAGPVTISGTANDNIAVDRNRLLVRDTTTGLYWNGSVWTPTWSWFTPTGTGSWSYSLTLAEGDYSTTAWTWDTSNNMGNITTLTFTVGNTDNTAPTIEINSPVPPSAGPMTITGTSTDNVAINRNRLLIQNTTTGLYWSGSVWTSNWSWFAPVGTDDWTYTLTLPIGYFSVTAWTWDSSNNIGNIATQAFAVGTADTTHPTVEITPPDSLAPGLITLMGTSGDNIAIDRNRLLILDSITSQYWTGSAWTSTWSWFAPEGIDSWSHDLILTTGVYSVTAWTWDTSNNSGNIASLSFSVPSN